MKRFIFLLIAASSAHSHTFLPLGLRQSPGIELVADMKQTTPIIVLGSGVGALSSSLYLARAGLEPVVIMGPMPGGLITQSHAIQNWPGEMTISGHELVEKMQKQAQSNGVKLVREAVTSVDFSKRPYRIVTRSLDDEQEREYRAEHVIIAMGTSPNHLNIPGETGPDGYWGRGVTNCAVCDGSFYRDLTVGVIGGGDAAVLEALYLANIAKEVHVFVRKESFRALEQKRVKMMLDKPNVKVHFNTTVEKILGDGEQVTGVVLKTGKKVRDFPLDGVFLAIGSTPNSKLFQGMLDLDAKGYIVLKQEQETSRKGIYAVGDIVDPVYKQAISAAGDGAKAALQAQQSIADFGEKGDKVAQTKTSLVKSEVLEITSVEQFDRELKASDTPIFVDFYASWCGPCKQIAPRLDKSAKSLSGQVKFLKVNVDRVQRLPGRYHIRSMPTGILFSPDGQILERKVGADQILALLKQLETGQ
jgi:thioredoxin reductase (NADPH)